MDGRRCIVWVRGIRIAWNDAGHLNVIAQASAVGWELNYDIDSFFTVKIPSLTSLTCTKLTTPSARFPA